MLTAFFRFIYLPLLDAVARLKEQIVEARVQAVAERNRASYERYILRKHGPEGLKIYRERSMSPEGRAALAARW